MESNEQKKKQKQNHRYREQTDSSYRGGSLNMLGGLGEEIKQINKQKTHRH